MLWFFINNQLGSWFETPVETAKMDKHFQSKTIIKQAIYCIYHKTCKSDCQIKAWPHAGFYWLSFDFTDIDSALACILESHIRHFWSFILYPFWLINIKKGSKYFKPQLLTPVLKGFWTVNFCHCFPDSSHLNQQLIVSYNHPLFWYLNILSVSMVLLRNTKLFLKCLVN